MKPKMTIGGDLLDWLGHGERGLSSESIVQHLTGFPALGRNWTITEPSDSDDLRRCRLLLESVPDLGGRFSEMASASGGWFEMVAAWPEMCAAMDAELPDWRDPQCHGQCPKTYEMIQAAEKRGMVRDGWVQVSPNSWRRALA